MSAQLREQLAARVELLKEKYSAVPTLTVILVGNDPASEIYVRNKETACASVGIHGESLRLPGDVSEDKLLEIIAGLNSDDGIDGILVQLPLPPHIDTDKVIRAICPEKDVDGFHPLNVAALWTGRPKRRGNARTTAACQSCTGGATQADEPQTCTGATVPCTPKGIMMLLDKAGETLDGRRAVVVGRSNIVGLPVAKLLLDRNATVTMAHSHTADLKSVTREADILVVAVGKPRAITADMVKPGAVVIDVGINRDPVSGKLCGDVDTEKVAEVASCITPVPGGVGPMTIYGLLENTVECFERRLGCR